MMPVLNSDKPTAVGVHIFAGGFTLGVKQAGFNVLAHLEGGKYGVSSAKLNWPKLPIYVGEENWPLTELAQKNIDFIYCNPPCAIFSSAGISTTQGKDAWRQDPRTDCWRQCFDVFLTVQPKVWAIESVTQAYSKGRELVDAYTSKALSIGYSAKHVLLDAKWVGLAQSRRRFFMIFHRPEVKLKLSFNFEEPPTVGEVLANIDDPGYVITRKKDSRFGKIYRRCVAECPPGEKLRNVYDRLYLGGNLPKDNGRAGKIVGRPGFLTYRLDPNKQMGAFIGSVFIHPTEDRLLGINEMKALCGYPQDFKLDGPDGQHPSLLARAVLPLVGHWLASAVKKGLASPQKRQSQSVEVIDLRRPEIPTKTITGQAFTSIIES